MAAPKPATPPRALGDTPSQVPPNPDPAKCDQSPGANRNAANPTPNTKATLARVTNNAVRPPVATVAQLMRATPQMASKATPVKPLMRRLRPATLAPACQ